VSSILSFRGTGTRRAIDKVADLRAENRRLTRAADDMACQLVAMATQIDELKTERNELKDSLDAGAIDYAGVLQDLDFANAEVARLRAELATRDAVTVPPMERDTTAVEDQATAPIDVRPLREAAELGLLGPVVRISTSGASADPGRIPAA
jgi:chromosome segregation ATPase